MPSSQARRGNEQRKAGDGADPRRSRAFSQPLKTPRKLLSGHSKDSNNNNNFSFGQMMSYMVYQNRVESEQRDCQNRIDAERREHEYELRCKELAVQHMENCAQHQLRMNVMMVAIFTKTMRQRSIVHPTIAQ